MKKVFKKSISVLMITVMCLTMAPLQGFVGLDMSGWFASEAKAAVVTSSTNIGVFQDYETAFVVVINGTESYEYVNKVTIDGKTYSTYDEDQISLDEAESLKNNKVIFTEENNVLVSISRFRVTNTKPQIYGNGASITYKDGWFSKKKFSVTGWISNILSGSDVYRSEFISNYYNSNGINQLTDIYITLKSPDKDKLYFDKGIFNGKECEMTFPLQRTIGAGSSDTFDCDIYVNRDYYPPSGSEDIEIECILNGYLNGVKVEGVFSSFIVNITNQDFYKKGETKEISLREFLESIQGDINRCNLLKSGEKIELSLKFTSALGWDSFANFDDEIGMLEVAYDMAGDLSGIGFKSVESTGKLYLETIIQNITSEMEDIRDFANSQLYELLNHKYFKIYISWYEAQLQQKNQSLSLYNILCPTDVIVTDVDGNIVLKIINNEIISCDSYVYAFVVDDEKYVYLPTDIEHNIEIIATDNGTMDYSVSAYTPAGLERTIEYKDVPLIKDEAYTAVAPCESMSETEVYNLISETGEEIEADYDSLPPVEDNIVDVIVAEDLFDGFSVEIIDLVADTMFNMNSVVDLSAYDISTDDVVALFSAVAKYYPAEYSLIANSDFTYKIIVSPNLDRIMKIRFYYGDDANLDTYQKRVKDLNSEIDALVAKVEGMNEFEKALYIHDYIVLNSEYDLELLEYMEANNCILPGELRSEKYTEYSILVNGTGVCGSYALAYRAVLNAAGMECLYLSSSQMNHAWNMVKIDGNWYHVDCCWDDPVPDQYGRARRTYFLRTDEEIMELNHYSWTPGQYKANSEKYSDMPRNYDIKQKYDDGKWYYLDGTTLYSTDEYGRNETIITSFSATSIDVDNGNIYYSMGRYVCSIIPETNKSACVYFLDSNHSGDDLNRAAISNIYIEGDNIALYKSVYDKEKGKTVTLYEEDVLQRKKFDAVTGISMTNKEIEIDVFSEQALNAVIESTSDVEGLEVTWTSSNNSVVSIDDNGKIKGMNVGEATITASVLNFTATCNVNVIGDGLSGTCGDKAIWSFEPVEGTLTISGTGSMSDYRFILWIEEAPPWYDFRNNIKKVVVESGITAIGDYSFYSCENLSKILISDSVTLIGDSVFSGCDSLVAITVDEKNETFSSDEAGVLFSKDKSSLLRYPIANVNLSYTVPNSVTTIGNSSFSGCETLSTINIPNSVTTIERAAFSGCTNLSTMSVPNSVVSIGNSAFSGCTNLSLVVLSKNITKISEYMFNNCVNLLNMVIPEKVTTIETFAFLGCTNLLSVTIPESVTIIEDAFRDCNSIEHIVVDKNNKNYSSDEYGVLFDKKKTTLIKYPIGNKRTEYTIPNTVTLIDWMAFDGCTSIENVIIPSSVTTIDDYAFDGCINLSNINIPSSVSTIGEFAFFGCDSFTDIIIPNGVKTIAGGAFDYCKNLIKITIPSSVTLIDYTFFGDQPFRSCDRLETIVVDKNNKNYSSDEHGVLFNKYKSKLIRYPQGNNATSYTIPSSVTTISSLAFDDSIYLKGVVIPNGITTIEESAFSGCKNLLHMGYICSKTKYSSINIASNNTQLTSVPYIHFDFNPDVDVISIEAKSSTCIEEGNTDRTYCVDCQCYIDGKIIPATGHNYNVVESVNGNCVTAPYDVYSCANCNDTYTKTGNIDNGHSYVETVIEPTCTEKGYTTATCSVCDETVVYDFTSPLGHKLLINRSASQCTAHGTLEYSCKNCDYTELVAADTTSLVTETVTVEPTCTKSGTKSEICVLCGATVSTEILNPLSHKYAEEYTVDVEATCTIIGRKSQHCIRCDAKRAVTTIEATGHQNTGIINATVATCTNNGYTGDTYCSDCKTVIATGESLSKLSHQYVAVVTEPTCTSKGFTTHTCTACGDSYTDAETAMISHSYSSVVTPVSCTSNGYTTYTCIVCSHSYTSDTVTSTGHNYNDNGICVGCGKNRTENCSHMCHKSGFMGFIWKILRFFFKLFKIQPVCSCGVAHY